MNRRAFLAGLSLAPVAAAGAVAATDTPNEHLRAVLGTADLPTPAYPIDLEQLEDDIASLQGRLSEEANKLHDTLFFDEDGRLHLSTARIPDQALHTRTA